MTREDILMASHACDDVVVSAETKKRVFDKEEGLKKILDIEIGIQLKPDQWARILEQMVLVALILGRWLLPKGPLSRDQFSQQMLIYIGMAADIAEVFESFREAKVMLVPALTYAILGVWSWSLLQFCLILGSDKKIKIKKQNQRIKRINADIMVISSSLLLQDLPFLCLRITLIFKFEVISHMNIFFTCKNTLVTLLQVYRLLVLILARRSKSPYQRRHSRLLSLVPGDTYEHSPQIRKVRKKGVASPDDFQSTSAEDEASRLRRKLLKHPTTVTQSSVDISKADSLSNVTRLKHFVHHQESKDDYKTSVVKCRTETVL